MCVVGKTEIIVLKNTRAKETALQIKLIFSDLQCLPSRRYLAMCKHTSLSFLSVSFPSRPISPIFRPVVGALTLCFWLFVCLPTIFEFFYLPTLACVYLADCILPVCCLSPATGRSIGLHQSFNSSCSSHYCIFPRVTYLFIYQECQSGFKTEGCVGPDRKTGSIVALVGLNNSTDGVEAHGTILRVSSL